jgi:hypothetical protein
LLGLFLENMSDRKRRKRNDSTAIASPPETPIKSKTWDLSVEDDPDVAEAEWTPKRRTRSTRTLESATSTLEPLLTPSAHERTTSPTKRQQGALEAVKLLTSQDAAQLLAGATDPGERYGDLNQDSYFAETFKSAVTGEPIVIIGVFDGARRSASSLNFFCFRRLLVWVWLASISCRFPNFVPRPSHSLYPSHNIHSLFYNIFSDPMNPG